MKEKETKHKGEGMAVVRGFRDTVFRMLFKEKEELLSLFNAINGTQYENAEDLEINTLENAVYMSMKNDISCVLDMRMNLYEHQSTVNPNMPLRYLIYVTSLYEKRIRNKDLYSRKQIPLPTPKFVVLYNGEEEQPARKEMRLSEAFMADTGEINLELVVLQLNINKSFNSELKKKCQKLHEYTLYVDMVRKYRRECTLEDAVEKAVSECIRKGILKDFLRKNRAEVVRMSIFEYNEELHRESLLEEGREEGRKEGREEGKRDIYCRMLKNNSTPEEISALTGESLEYLYRLQESNLAVVQETNQYKTET